VTDTAAPTAPATPGGPARPPAAIRPAASLLLLRDLPGADGRPALHVLLLKRAERPGDAQGGATVFPGGVLDARDAAARPHLLGAAADDWAARLALPQGALDYAVAALRECFEEAGLLLAAGPDGAPPDPQALAGWRARLQRGEAGVAEFCAATGLRLDLRALRYHAHWLTPPGMPRRFDTRFFIAPAPQGQVPVADGGETVAVEWLTPQAALDPARALKLLPVTQVLLQGLQRFACAADALAHADTRPPVACVMPRVARTRRGRRVVLPHELPYAEIGHLDPDGRGDARADIEPGEPVALWPGLWRVTAPNAGPMTGPGTNSWLLGAAPDFTVIDPGPRDPAHVQALQDAAAAAGGRIVRILATHTHRDHSPAAALLAQATGAAVWGRLASHPEWQDDSFAPAHQPVHGERIAVAPGLTLRVLHTPGHASNHLCFLWTEQRLLFTGDHVMQGSTVVINPPDGDMAAYLSSLQALLDEDLQWLAPGHGFLVAQPDAVVRALISHRLGREAKVVRVLREAGPAPLADLLPHVYDDVNPALHPVAARSLRAHLLKLQHDGVAGERDGVWALPPIAAR
jgi:glyoxylase-like metal-dependent hydrolase (beta-lactamase superfamily II)/8-oxo-dGTP pyrophosphatase MutT (NUDIX family)